MAGEVPKYITLYQNLPYSKNSIERDFLSSQGVNDIDYEFLAGDDTAFRLKINLSQMPEGETLHIGSFGRAICDAILLINNEITNGQNIMEITSIHHRPDDRDQTVETIHAENINHISKRRQAFYLSSSEYPENKNITKALGEFTNGGRVMPISTSEKSELSLLLQKQGGSIGMDFYTNLEKTNAKPFYTRRIPLA